MRSGRIGTAGERPETEATELVWDPLVRVGHWLLVLLFAVSYLSGDELKLVHVWSGYAICAYLVVRIVWGLIGPAHARFADFIHGPREALRYLLDLLRFRAERHVGHSPAGGLMVIALLVCLVATSICGMALLAVDRNQGPLSPWLGTQAGMVVLVSPAMADEHDAASPATAGTPIIDKRTLKGIHELLANFTLFLVILHVGGVVLASIAHGENLARAMVTGRKRAE